MGWNMCPTKTFHNMLGIIAGNSLQKRGLENAYKCRIKNMNDLYYTRGIERVYYDIIFSHIT